LPHYVFWECGLVTFLIQQAVKTITFVLYHQIIHIEFSELPLKNFESDWQKWWLERGNNGVPVLHLEGYRLCGYNAGISCDILGGSGVHMCQVDYKEIAGEGVLYVMGESEITLSLPLGLEDSYGYWRSP
jgi:hypothetical protein